MNITWLRFLSYKIEETKAVYMTTLFVVFDIIIQ